MERRPRSPPAPGIPLAKLPSNLVTVTGDPAEFTATPNADGTISSIFAVQTLGPTGAEQWFGVIGLGQLAGPVPMTSAAVGELHIENAAVVAPIVTEGLAALGIAATSEVVVPVLVAGTVLYFVWRYTVGTSQAPAVAQSIDDSANGLIASPMAQVSSDLAARAHTIVVSMQSAKKRCVRATSYNPPPPDGPPPCLPVDPITRAQVLTDLASFWDNDVSMVCPYAATQLPNSPCPGLRPNNASYCPVDEGIYHDPSLHDTGIRRRWSWLAHDCVLCPRVGQARGDHAPNIVISSIRQISRDVAVFLWAKLPCRDSEPNNASYCPVDEGIYYDLRFMMGIRDDWSWLAHDFVLAHEWGHHNQLLAVRFQTNNLASELDADCQAGMFAAYEEAQYGMPPAILAGALLKIFTMGDPVGTSEFDPAAHGSPKQRQDAFTRG